MLYIGGNKNKKIPQNVANLPESCYYHGVQLSSRKGDYVKFKDISEYEKQMEELREDHRRWKATRRKENSPFIQVFSDFKEEHLRDISGGALKLYLFLSFHANSSTGECWISTEKIAAFFGNESRTVKKWIEELEHRELIKRIQVKYRRVANSFLKPYGQFKNQEG